MAVALPNFPTILSAAGHSRRRPNSKKSNTQKKNQNTVATSSLGFSSKTKDPVWQCVERCGACCKLEKGPTYPSPDEIFDDPSDVQVSPSFLLLACLYIHTYIHTVKFSYLVFEYLNIWWCFFFLATSVNRTFSLPISIPMSASIITVTIGYT